jgi:hypothetical protein
MLAEQRVPSGVMTNGAARVEVASVAALAAPLAAPAPTAPQARRRQSQRQLARLDAVARMLDGLTTADAAFQSAMAGAGLMEEYLAECNARCAAAEQAVEVRHLAMIEALMATEALAAANFQARAAYSAFRQVARTIVTSSSGQAALDLDEATPTDRAAFLRTAAATLTTAQGEPYASLLQAATFGPERMAATLATLDVLATAATVQAAAQHRAKLATQARDAAMHELATVARQIKVEVRTLLRRNPQLAPPVGFSR